MKPFERFNDIVTACEEQASSLAHGLARNGRDVNLGLYYLPSTDMEDGRLLMVQEGDNTPTGYLLAVPEHLNGGIPYANYWSWIRAHSMRIPILIPL